MFTGFSKRLRYRDEDRVGERKGRSSEVERERDCSMGVNGEQDVETTAHMVQKQALP